MNETFRTATRQLRTGEALPFDLLLLAEETIEAIEKYVYDGDVFLLESEQVIVGIYVLKALDHQQVEIKNIAVREKYQGQGIGQFLLADAEKRAGANGFREIIVGTPAVSKHLIRFYEHCGFEQYDLRVNFYLDNYPDPIFENDVQLKDMVLLKRNYSQM